MAWQLPIPHELKTDTYHNSILVLTEFHKNKTISYTEKLMRKVDFQSYVFHKSEIYVLKEAHQSADFETCKLMF